MRGVHEDLHHPLPHPHPGSFNPTIADHEAATLRESGHTITVHDFYREQFDPLLPYEEILRYAPLSPVIALHGREIAAADGIIFVHPDWWGMPPAILKGRIDRVLRPGVAYRFAETDSRKGIPVGLLVVKGVLVFNTSNMSNTPAERDLEVLGDPLERLWKDGIVSFCGMPIFHRKMFSVVITSTEEQRRAWLNEVHEITRMTFPHNSS
jgi:NAD(P)H dehydrogenase (quinone)